MKYDITTNWTRTFSQRHPELSEALTIAVLWVAISALTILALYQLDPYCWEYACY
jgi:hypothetical protein